MHNTTMQAQRLIQTFSQQENAARTYTINWASVIDTDTIATSTWTAENNGTVANEASDNTTASARLSGTPGKYLFTNKITTTTGGDTLEAQIMLIVRDNEIIIDSAYVDVSYQ